MAKGKAAVPEILLLHPRKYWAVLDPAGNAPPCIAGSRGDAVELRDSDESIVEVLTASPAWFQGEVQSYLVRALEQMDATAQGFGVGPVDVLDELEAIRLLVSCASLNLERAVKS